MNYIEHPLSANELKKIIRSGGLKPQDVVRTREEKYKKLVEGKDLSDDELIKVMAANPEIIQRPLVVRGKKAVLARPVERLKDLGV